MTTTTAAIQQALELLKAGDKATAQSILIPVLKAEPNNAEAWYLLAFTLPDQERRLECFQEVLRIDPENQAAKKQIARLTTPQPVAGVAHVQPAAYSTPSQPARPVTDSTPIYAAAPRQSAAFAQPVEQVSDPKPGKTRRALPLELILGGVVVLVILGILGAYLWNGMNTNQKVAGLFAQGSCNEVAGYAGFGKTFPKAIFGSMFSVYGQVEECQAWLALEQALNAQDWSSAYIIIGNYLQSYPNGAFAAEMQPQVGEVLLAWTQSLAAENRHELAIQQLKDFQKRYPDSPSMPAIREAMVNHYLLLAKTAFEKKNYPEAETHLKVVINAGEAASPNQMQQATQGLAVIYMEWGQAQAKNGEIEPAIEHYNAAQQLDPGLADFDRLKTQAELTRATSQAAKGNFDKALTEVSDILAASESEAGKIDALAAQEKILNDFAHSTSMQAQEKMADVAKKMCQKELPELPIFGIDAEQVRLAVVSPFNVDLSSGNWLANTPAELHYVLCVEETQKVVQTCPYSGGFTVRRIEFTWVLSLYDLGDGKVFKTTKLKGSTPPRCGGQEWFSGGSSGKDVLGGRPTVQQIETWLNTLKLVP